MQRPKITVLMSVYNGEKYLREATDSILNQTFRDFEFIIINDGSTDDTSEILENYDDPRIIVINNRKNIGLTKSLNKGLRMAKGEYIARQDADDISFPQRLEKEVNFLEKHKRVGLIGSSFQLISENGKSLTTHKVLTTNEEIKKGLREGNRFGHGSVMFRRECLDKVGFYREEFRSAQDYDLWLRISEKYNVANISEPLYKWRASFKAVSIAKKDEQDKYAEFARELARERREQWTDRLQTSTKEEIEKILDNLFPKTRKKDALIDSYYYWGRFLYCQGAYRDALKFLKKSFFRRPLSKKTLILILKTWLNLIFPRRVIVRLKTLIER